MENQSLVEILKNDMYWSHEPNKCVATCRNIFLSSFEFTESEPIRLCLADRILNLNNWLQKHSEMTSCRVTSVEDSKGNGVLALNMIKVWNDV